MKSLKASLEYSIKIFKITFKRFKMSIMKLAILISKWKKFKLKSKQKFKVRFFIQRFQYYPSLIQELISWTLR